MRVCGRHGLAKRLNVCVRRCVGLHSCVCLLHSRGLLPRPDPVHPLGAGGARHEPGPPTAAATSTAAPPTHLHQTGTQTGTVASRRALKTLKRSY